MTLYCRKIKNRPPTRYPFATALAPFVLLVLPTGENLWNRLSSVEHVLRQDITGTYPLMDFATRDRYRHVVERISKSCDLSETEVAQKVLELTKKNKNGDPHFKRKEHVGYYLIDKGLRRRRQPPACVIR